MLAMSGTTLKEEKFQVEPKASGAAWIARIWVWSKFMENNNDYEYYEQKHHEQEHQPPSQQQRRG